MGFMTAPSAEGDFKVFVSYNAKAGRWYTKEDKPDAQQFEVSDLTAVFDIPNIKTGWFLFAAGAAPQKVFDPSLSEAAPKPGEGFKRGFELDVFSNKNLLGVREFASTAGIVIDSMNALYDAYLAAPEAKQGKLPVVKCTGVVPVTNKHGTNYAPTLSIVSWTDRPAELIAGMSPATSAPPPVTGQVPPPATPSAGHVPPPPAQPAPVGIGPQEDVEF